MKEVNYMENAVRAIRRDENINGSKLIAYKNDENKDCIFFGHKDSHVDSKKDYKDAKWFTYKNNQKWNYINNKTNISEGIYTGELIEFKKDINSEAFYNIFENICNSIEENAWSNLFDALASLSEILDINSEEELEATVKGYIGEICFMFWLMKHCTNKKFVYEVFSSYQKKEAKKHDFTINKDGINGDVRIEIKSSQGQKGNFMMKASQQMDNFEDELFYGYVRYELSENDNSISLQTMLNDVYDYMPNPNREMPNHLMINSRKYNFKKIGVNLSSIKVYIVNNNDLPNFEAFDKSMVNDITYKLDLSIFISKMIKEKGYTTENALNSLIEKVED